MIILTQFLPSEHLCIHHQDFVPHRKPQRSAAPAEGAPPQTVCTDSWHSLHTNPARRDWILHLCSTQTDSRRSSLCLREDCIVIDTEHVNKDFIIRPPLLLFLALLLPLFSHFSLHVSVLILLLWFLFFCLTRTGSYSSFCTQFVYWSRDEFLPVQVCLSSARW